MQQYFSAVFRRKEIRREIERLKKDLVDVLTRVELSADQKHKLTENTKRRIDDLEVELIEIKRSLSL